MKRFLAGLLLAVMIFSVSSCSYLTPENWNVTEDGTQYQWGENGLPIGFSAGFARETVNPQNGTAMAGYDAGNTRLSSSIKDDIKLTCTALSDGEQILLLYSMDSLFVPSEMVDQVTRDIGTYLEGYSVPAANIIMNATHTHSGPSLHFSTAIGMKDYLKDFYPVIYRLAQEAIEDLDFATVHVTRTETEDLNYVRRYVSLDGTTFIGNWPSSGQDPTKVRHETEADHEMQLIRFKRAVKRDILLCNWQCHPCSSGIGAEKSTAISPDWVGPFRDAVEHQTGVLFSYHQGAAGNVVSSGRMRGDSLNSDYVKKGKKLADTVKVALKNTEEVKTGKFRVIRHEYYATHTPSYAQSKKSETQKLYLSTFSIGDVAFATTPYEMFDANGMQVKEKSPFKMTFMCAYTNGQYNYVPANYAYAVGGYECKKPRFVQGTAEIVVDILLKNLNELYRES